MNLPPSELENITPYQFNLLREGYNEAQKEEWKRSRFIAYWVYTMAGKVAEGNVTIEAFRPLDEADLKAVPEQITKIPEYTPDELAKFDKMFNPDK